MPLTNPSIPTPGQVTIANSSPVVIASDQSAIPIIGTVTLSSSTVNQGTPASIANSWTVKLTDGTSAIASVANAGLTYIANALIQNVKTSATNNSTSNLASSASFTGTSESTLGVAGIQVNFKADQVCTVQCQQSTDGTNWDIADSYVLAASTGDGRTFQATGAFFRIIVTNNGGSATTFLRLQSVLCPIVETLPRSLTTSGSLKVALQEIVNVQTYSASVSAFTCPEAATDIFTIQGSATKIIKINRISVTGTTSAGSGSAVSMTIVKRSTANTGGTSATVTNTPHDSANGVATATVKNYTANPTLGTSVGNISSFRLTVNTAGSLNNEFTREFGARNDQPVVLRGTAETLAVNFGGVTITNPLISISIEWTEEPLN